MYEQGQMNATHCFCDWHSAVYFSPLLHCWKQLYVEDTNISLCRTLYKLMFLIAWRISCTNLALIMHHNSYLYFSYRKTANWIGSYLSWNYKWFQEMYSQKISYDTTIVIHCEDFLNIRIIALGNKLAHANEVTRVLVPASW